VRDHNKLALVGESIQDLDESVYVRLVQGRVHFIEHAESTRHVKFSCRDGLQRAINRFIVSEYFRTALGIIAIIVCGWIGERGASASTITYSGEDINAQSWRTTSVSKPLISDGSGIYGKDGYAVFAIAPNGVQNAPGTVTGVTPFSYVDSGNSNVQSLVVTPSYVSAFTPSSGFTTIKQPGTFPRFDDPRVAGGQPQIDSGIGSNLSGSTSSFVPVFSFTVNSSVPKSFNVTLLFTNNAGQGQISAAQIKSSIGGIFANGTQSTINNVDALVFLINGAVNNEVFTIGLENSGTGPLNADIAGIAFNTATPEPSTVAVSAIGIAALILFGESRGRRASARHRIH
jgi:hypothetical protein